mmetsp:Transcript_73684/g.159452  ORF Transcript_73684/g.159452 Transcript_73684/m.159452 type:complete len:284 (-) Transcript_73684:143-994(-)|eukprot:CAMPEP_0170603606 /NCGR_PEP_ID=MMETSP0224-20130122/18999_1 /TAXON_ID=285029 /ORGANISM="Togula jolla, Strain CCCM 725" /LENGTH=283 /DNA_ID=CAMNT_0010928493 /DNA_START=90 /DNA_END=941 /DNA_ORIENTATION=-
MVSMEDFKDPTELRALVLKYVQTQAFRTWGTFVAFAFVVFWVFSSGDFSFLLTLSSLVSMFSFLMVAMTIESGKTVKGVSLKMMECYIFVFFCRLCAIIPFEGYLPFDKSGDWLYQVCEAFGLCLAGSIVYCCRVQYASTYDPATDTLNHLYLILPALGVALILHPHLNNFLPSDIAWAFALYLESVTVLPQLFMFMKEGKAQPHTSHFLAAQALSRLMSFIFWASSFSELSNPDHYIKQFVGNWVVVVQLVQLLVMGDFIYHYIRCIQKGIPVSEVLCSSNV